MSRTTDPAPAPFARSGPREEAEGPLYRRIERDIEAAIRRDGLGEGTRLPSIASLAESFGVNGLTVRRAISELSLRGVVVTRQGKGTFVAAPQPAVVKWTSGVDLFHGDISSFYTSMLRKTTRLLGSGLTVEPLWSRFDPTTDTAPSASVEVDPGAAAYIFCGCAPTHPLLQAVREARRPHVHVAHALESNAWTASINPAEGARLAFEHLADAGCRRVGVMAIDDYGAAWLPGLAEDAAITLDRVEVPGSPRSLTVWETRGYDAGITLATKLPPCDAWYIPDDILARGASRILLSMPPTKRPALVVQTSQQQAVPLGVPTTHVTFDLDELARHTAELLTQQLEQTPGDTARALPLPRRDRTPADAAPAVGRAITPDTNTVAVFMNRPA